MTDSVFTGINHICVVTRDIERAVRVWSDKYGVRPWSVYSYDASNMSVSIDGERLEFGMRVGLCHVGPTTRIEIIQPLDDDSSPYAKSLTANNNVDHIHHVRLDIADYDQAFERLEGLGLPTLLNGEFKGGEPGSSSAATYFATEDDLGFIVEIARRPAEFVMFEPDFVYPPEAAGPPTAV